MRPAPTSPNARLRPRLRRSLREAAERVGTFPRGYPVAYEARTLGHEVRLQVHGSYRILFTVQPGRVLILRVRHGARRRLGEEE
jgi:plasmid stabilization system protein ParE